MKTPTETLIEGRALIARGWCQGTYARDKDGQTQVVHPSLAVSWCAVGALRHVLHWDYSRPYEDARDFLNQAAPNGAIIDFNDWPQTTQADILSVYDKAIELAERNANAKP